MEKGHPMDGLELSFSASGWLMVHGLGIAYAFQKHGIRDAKAKFVGSSGGAAVSAALALDVDAKMLSDFMIRCCVDYHKDPVRKMFQMREYAKNCILRCMDSDTFRHDGLTSGKLNVAITLLPSCKGVIVNNFASNEEYLEAVLGSCTMSPFAGWPFPLNRPGDEELHNKFVFDGGMTQLIPRLSDNTITATPFYCFDADIKPSRYVPIHWAVFPPPPKEFEEIFWLGVKDGMTWLQENGYAHLKLSKKVLALKREEGQQVPARIKPIVRRGKVSLHSTHDSNRSALNPHSHGVRSRGAIVIRSRSNSASSSSSGDSMNSDLQIRKLMSSEVYKVGNPISGMDLQVHRAKDSLTFVAAATVKPIAIGVVYAELWSRAVLSAAHTAVAAVENRRRSKIEPSKGYLSMRRWVHDGMLGSATDSWSATREYVSAAMDPSFWLNHLPIVGKKFHKDEEKNTAVHETLKEKSVAYRYFLRASW